MYWLLSVLCMAPSAASSPDVFSQLGVDGTPVRWERSAIVLSVSQPPPGPDSIGYDQFVDLTREAAQIFNGALGVEFEVVKLKRALVRTQEDGINEVALKAYRPCHPIRDALDKSQCNDDNRYANTRVYPANRREGQTHRTIVEGDIEINLAKLGNLNSRQQRDRLVAVLRHEMGHLLGLAHNCVATKTEQSQYKGSTKPPLCGSLDAIHTRALMYPFTPSGVALPSKPNGAEWAFLKALYPSPATNTSWTPPLWSLLFFVLLALIGGCFYAMNRKRRKRHRGTPDAS